MTLDVRGKRAEELWGILQRYIDDAVLLSIPEVRILHGKGNGVLRQVTRDYLRTVKEVKRYRDEAVENGGSGITVVEFGNCFASLTLTSSFALFVDFFCLSKRNRRKKKTASGFRRPTNGSIPSQPYPLVPVWYS